MKKAVIILALLMIGSLLCSTNKLMGRTFLYENKPLKESLYFEQNSAGGVENQKDLIVLRKKNKPLTEQMKAPNTIYEIRRKYNLKGQALVIPANCTLVFNGGNITNGIIILDNTEIRSNKICFKKIERFSGSIRGAFNMDWVDISESDDVSDLVKSIIDVTTSSKALLLSQKQRTFHVMDIEVVGKKDFSIDCNCVFKFPDNLPKEQGKDAHNIIKLTNCSNFTIKNLILDGNSVNNYCYEWDPLTKRRYDIEETNFKNEYRHCLSIFNCHNSVFNRITGLNPSGDVVYLGGTDGYEGNSNLFFDTIEGRSVDLKGKGRACGRNVVSVINGNHLFFDNIYSYYVGHATMPGGFDIEPNHNSNQYCDNIVVNKLYHEGKSNVGLGIGGTVYGHVNNVEIHEAIIKNHLQGKEQRPVDILGVNNLTIGKLEVYPSYESVGVNINVSGGRPYSQNIRIDSLYIEDVSNAIQVCNADDVSIKATIRNWTKGIVYFVYKEGTTISNSQIDITAYSDSEAERNPERFFQFESQVKNVKLSGHLTKTNIKRNLVAAPFYIRNSINHLDIDVSDLEYDGYNRPAKINWK